MVSKKNRHGIYYLYAMRISHLVQTVIVKPLRLVFSCL